MQLESLHKFKRHYKIIIGFKPWMKRSVPWKRINLGRLLTSHKLERLWMQVGLHIEILVWWHIGSLQSKVSCKTMYSNLWCWLWGEICSNGKDEYYQNHSRISNTFLLELQRFDVKNAFLHNEEVCMEIPLSFKE